MYNHGSQARVSVYERLGELGACILHSFGIVRVQLLRYCILHWSEEKRLSNDWGLVHFGGFCILITLDIRQGDVCSIAMGDYGNGHLNFSSKYFTVEVDSCCWRSRYIIVVDVGVLGGV